MFCGHCRVTFSKFSNYKAHVKKFHPADFNELPPHKPKDKAVAQCTVCRIEFVKLSNLKAHMKRFHAAESLGEKKIYNYKCDVCNKQFSHLRHFKYHQKNHDMQADTNKILKCPICLEDFQKQAIFKHFKNYHTIKVEIEVLQFPNVEMFKTWKIELEKNEKSSFVKQVSYSTKNAVRSEYICHRSGYFTSKSKGARHLKTQGTNKINAFCPASLKVTETNHDCEVVYVKTHIGHDNDVGHLFLTEANRTELAAKIAAKVPFDSILDGIRDSVTNGQLDRLHLLTKKDLFNIEQCFQLNNSSVRHKNDAVSVEAWVNEMKNCRCVLYYKPQDSVCLKYPILKKEDFVLVIMNEGQKEMLQRYGSDCICLDGTHGLNAYGFELNTLLVLDQMREGFPCSFLISNRSDETVMTIFFSHIREVLETQLKPKVFMSDMAESFYNAWQHVMLPADVRLFCTWHLDRAWRKNLKKVDSKEMQVVVYQKLRALLQETDMAAFNCMIQGFITSMMLNPMTSEFGSYFQQNYLHNVTSWAYCHRLHCGLNTNMHIERMHRSIKYLYLHGKTNKRLDKAINAILKFVRDKLFDQIISQNKGKLCTKIKVLRQRHKTSEKLDMNSVLATASTDTNTIWQVPSSTSNEIYLVEERKTDCNCKLLCSDCNVCLHHYSCTCLDCAIQWNMCKHIHLVCRYRKTFQTVEPSTSQSSDTEENLTIVEKDSFDSTIVACISKEQKMDDNFENKLKEFKAAIMLQLEDIKTSDQLEAVKKICAPIRPTLDAIKTSTICAQSSKSNASIPHNKKITPQRRLYSTKKTAKKSQGLSKPGSQQTNAIAMQLLMNNS